MRYSAFQSTRRAYVNAVLISASIMWACGGGGDNGGVTNPQPKSVATVAVALNASQIEVTKTVQASATLRDSDGNALSGRSISWTSSTPSVASVSQSGLVTGVSVGSTQITATSESVIGSAALTVVADPATAADVEITGLTQNGVAVDVSNVAGIITIEVEETIPQGFVGTVEIRVDTFLVERTAYPAPVSAENSAESNAAFSVIRRRKDFNTSAVSVISASDINDTKIQSIETLLKNGPHVLSVNMSGNAGAATINVRGTASFSSANPNGLAGFGQFVNERTLVKNAFTYRTGNGFKTFFIVIDYNTPAAAPIKSIELVTGDASAVYGGDVTNGVTNVVLRNQTVSNDDFVCESGASGTGFKITDIEFEDGTSRDPINNPWISAGGYTSDANGDGMFDVRIIPSGFPLPTGTTGQTYLPSLDAEYAGFLNLVNTMYCDNQNPSFAGFPFLVTGRNTAFYDPVSAIGGLARPLDNYLATNTDLSWYLNPDMIADRGVGLAEGAGAVEYFVSDKDDIDNLYAIENKWSLNDRLDVAAGYDYVAGFRAYDKFGQSSEDYLRTTSRNSIGLDGLPTSAGEIAAIWPVELSSNAAMEYTGTPDGTATSSLGNLELTYRFGATGLLGTGFNYLTGSFKRNDVCVLGTQPDCGPVVMPSLLSGSDLFFYLSTVSNEVGGNLEGKWEGTFTGYARSGEAFAGGTAPIRLLYDAQNPWLPTAPGNAITSPFNAGQEIEFPFGAGDNVHVAGAAVMLGFEGLQSSVFSNGFVEVPWIKHPFVSWKTDLSTSLSSRLRGSFPTHVALAASGTDIVTSPYTPISKYSLFSRDGVGLRSPPLSFPVNGSYLPSYSPFTNLRVATFPFSNQVCSRRFGASTSCPTGVGNTMKFVSFARYPSMSNPGIEQVQVFGVGPDKNVVPLCQASAPVSLTPDGSYMLAQYECEKDFDRYTGPEGYMTVFGWFYSPTKSAAGKTQFSGTYVWSAM